MHSSETQTPSKGRREAKPKAKKAYRGCDNPKAKKPVSRAVRVMVLVPREAVPKVARKPLLPGRKSRRKRQNQWIPVTG